MVKSIMTATVVSIVMLFAVNTYAYSDDVFSSLEMEQADGAYTVITDIENDVHYLDGIIDADKLEYSSIVSRIASYEIYIENDKIISVELNDILSKGDVSLSNNENVLTNGYYAVKFMLSDEENTTCFLTGLSDTNLNMVQKKLISAKLENSEFTMESLDFIDAEKTNISEFGDDQLCWAASTSNMLRYTGWNTKAQEENTDEKFDSEDDILDLFNSEFTDFGSSQIYGIQWFFDGSYIPQTFGTGWSRVKNYGISGGYLKKYFWDDLIDYVDLAKEHRNINKVTNALEQGSGAGITLGWISDDGQRNGGHAITMWGYICDNDFNNTDLEYMKALIVSDSDSERISDENRRIAPNKMQVLNTKPYTQNGYDTWSFDGYSGGSGVLESITLLPAYTDDIKCEDNPNATLDTINNSELYPKDVYISIDRDIEAKVEKAEKDEIIYAVVGIENDSDIDFNNDLEYRVQVSDSVGNIIYDETKIENVMIKSYESKKLMTEIKGLDVGEYTLSVTVNPEHKITEAYYYNNTYTCNFSVVESFIDKSDVIINAEIGEFNNGMADVELSYTQLDLITKHFYHPTYTLYTSYFKDGEWSDFSKANVSMEEPVGKFFAADVELPDRCRVYSSGEKIKFKLLIEEDNNIIESSDLQAVVINSQEYNLKFARLNLYLSDSNTDKYTNLDRNETKLKEGEIFAFNIKNTSTYDNGNASCSVSVYAVNKLNYEEKELLYSRDNIAVGYGEISDTISFNSWNVKLSGTYDIIAEINGNCGFDTLMLGTLSVKEQQSSIVTASDDIVDEFDGKISFREAVIYAENTDEIVTFGFEDDKNIVYLNEPINISNKVTVKSANDNMLILYNDENIQLIKVEENGIFNASNLVFYGGYSLENGGGIENKGGEVNLTECLLYNCKSGALGGAISSDGGSVKLKNCNLRSNTSGYGGAIGLQRNAQLNMLNCNVFDNISNGGAVYNNGASATITYSSFFNNTAKYEGGGAVTSIGKMNMIGCVTALNGNMDLSGDITLYGSYYSNADSDVIKDEYSVKASGNRIFVCLPDNKVIYENHGNICEIYVSPLVQTGIYIKIINDKISYSANNIDWKNTDVSSVFTDEDFMYDCRGIKHEAMFGAYWEAKTEIRFIDSYNGNLVLYVPYKMDGVLIEKTENLDGEMLSVRTDNKEFDVGTNMITVPIDKREGIKTYILWNSLEIMQPLCKPYIK